MNKSKHRPKKKRLFTKLIVKPCGVRLKNTTPICFIAVTNANSSKKIIKNF
jgi:hypothetical protein